jgi:hypothetical protein
MPEIKERGNVGQGSDQGKSALSRLLHAGPLSLKVSNIEQRQYCESRSFCFFAPFWPPIARRDLSGSPSRIRAPPAFWNGGGGAFVDGKEIASLGNRKAVTQLERRVKG